MRASLGRVVDGRDADSELCGDRLIRSFLGSSPMNIRDTLFGESPFDGLQHIDSLGALTRRYFPFGLGSLVSLVKSLKSFISPPKPETKAAPVASAPVARDDSWQNPFLGYGTARDKLQYGFHAGSLRLSDEELSTLFYSDDVAAKLVEKRPEEAFRRGYKLCSATNPEGAANLQELGRTLDVDKKVQEGATWGRLYGGSLIVVGAEQGSPTTPLDETRVRGVRFLNVVDRRYAAPVKYYEDPLSANFGEAEIYSVTGVRGTSTYIHESRVIRFDGLTVDARKRQELAGWSYSVLQRPYDVMRTFATAFQSAGTLTADASQAVFKMKGLFEMIASGEKERLQTRMQLVDMSRSAARSVLLDSDGEDFTRVPTVFTGIPEMLDRMMMRLASAVDMPVTILMGRSPAGQNATGDSDFKHWYNSIASQQEKDFTPRLLRLYRILSRGTIPDLKIEWCSLDEPTEKEEAEIEKYRADRFATYIDKGVLFPQEVALAQFGKSTNGEILIDEDSRIRSLKDELSFDIQTNAAKETAFTEKELAVLAVGGEVSPLVAAQLLGELPGPHGQASPRTAEETPEEPSDDAKPE